MIRPESAHPEGPGGVPVTRASWPGRGAIPSSTTRIVAARLAQDEGIVQRCMQKARPERSRGCARDHNREIARFPSQSGEGASRPEPRVAPLFDRAERRRSGSARRVRVHRALLISLVQRRGTHGGASCW